MANVGHTTVDELARSVLSSVDSNTGLWQVAKWASDRYRQLSNRGKLRALRVVTALTIPAAITDGLATFTRGSTSVTGDSDAQAVWKTAISSDNDDTAAVDTAQTIVGRYIRFSRNWYKVANLEGAVIRLETPVTEADSDDTSYYLVQRFTRLPADLRYLGTCVHQRMWRTLAGGMSSTEYDLMHPEKQFVTGTGPEAVIEIGDDDDGVRLAEFYPYSLNNETILFTYYKRSPELKLGMRLPDNIDIEALKMGVLIDVYRYEMAKALRANQIEAGAVWRNELRAQETTWKRRIEEMLHADRATDDVSLILHTRGMPHPGDSPGIKTASQDALSRFTGLNLG